MQHIHVHLPLNDFILFDNIAKRLGWQYEETPNELSVKEEKEYFFEGSKKSMAEHLEKYL